MLLLAAVQRAWTVIIALPSPIIPITLIYNKKPQIDAFNIKVRLFADNPINTLNYNIEQKDFLLVKVKETINKNLKKLNIEDEN